MSKDDHLFPKLDHDDFSKDGQPIYGGSIGMNRVYDHLVQSADKPGASPFRVIVINALTLIRNNYDANYNKCSDACRKDIQTLMTYLSVYLRKKHDAHDRKVTILIMYPDYQMLPETLRRPASAEMKRLLPIYQRDVKSIPDKLTRFYNDDVLQLFSVRCGSRKTYPHQDLRSLLYTQINNEKNGKAEFSFRVNDAIHLITHFSMDWHLNSYFKDVNLLESYTGDIITSQYFGSKLIGKKDIKVPFDSFIHQVFGDKTLVKPLAVRNKKKILLDSATKWSMMSNTKILQIVSDTLSLPVSSLTKYKFI